MCDVSYKQSSNFRVLSSINGNSNELLESLMTLSAKVLKLSWVSLTGLKKFVIVVTKIFLKKFCEFGPRKIRNKVLQIFTVWYLNTIKPERWKATSCLKHIVFWVPTENFSITPGNKDHHYFWTQGWPMFTSFIVQKTLTPLGMKYG